VNSIGSKRNISFDLLKENINNSAKFAPQKTERLLQQQQKFSTKDCFKGVVPPSPPPTLLNGGDRLSARKLVKIFMALK